mgnify:CR=1 FL=1
MGIPNQDYWTLKILALLHDPIDKPFVVSGHVKRAKDILEQVNLSSELNKWENWINDADIRASASDRLPLPKEFDPNRTFDWCRSKRFLFHPLSSNPLVGGEVPIADISNLAEGPKVETRAVREIVNELVSGWKDFSSKITEKMTDGIKRLLNDKRKAFLWLWRRLDNLHGERGLRGLILSWLPAETRVPDHSIYDHLITTSALIEEDISILSLDIGGIRSFISHSRKVRDLWASSYLVSMLSMAALMEVLRTIGPDSVIFPDLRGNPLVDLYLYMEGVLSEEELKELWGKDGFKRRFAKALLTSIVPGTMMIFAPTSKAKEIEERVVKSMRETMKRILSTLESCMRKIEGTVFTISLDDLPYPLKVRVAQVRFEEVKELDDKVRKCGQDKECVNRLLKDYIPQELWKGCNFGNEMLESLVELLIFRNSIDGFSMKYTTLYFIAVKILQLKMAVEKAISHFSLPIVEATVGTGGSEVRIRRRCRLCGVRNPVVIDKVSGDEREAWRTFLNEIKRHRELRWMTTLLAEDEPLCPVCLTKRLLRSVSEEGPNLLMTLWSSILGLKEEEIVRALKDLGVWEELLDAAKDIPTLDDIACQPAKRALKDLISRGDDLAERIVRVGLHYALRAAAEFYLDIKTALEGGKIGENGKWIVEEIETFLSEIGNMFPEFIEKFSKNLDASIDYLIKRFEKEPMTIPGTLLYPVTWERLSSVMRRAESLLPELSEKINIWQKNLKDLIFDLRKFDENTESLTNYLALIYFDGDRMGEWLSGSQLIRAGIEWRNRFHEDFLKLMEDEEKQKFPHRAYKLPTPSYHRTLSRLVRQMSIEVFPKVVEELGGFVFFSGGDDLLAVVPVQEALKILVTLHTVFSAEIIRLREKEFLIGLGQKASASSGLVVFHRLNPLRDMLDAVYEEEDISKGERRPGGMIPDGERDRSSIIRISRGQSSERAVIKGEILDLRRRGNYFVRLTSEVFSLMRGRDGIRLSKSFLRDMIGYLEILAATVSKPGEDMKLVEGMIGRCIERNLSGKKGNEVRDGLQDLYMSMIDLEDVELKKHVLYHTQLAITLLSKEVRV